LVGVPLMLIAFVPHELLMDRLMLDMATLSYIMLAVSLPAFVYTSYPIFDAAWRTLKNMNLTMDVMYAMGIGVAYAASVMGTFEIVLTREFMFYDSALLLAAFLMVRPLPRGPGQGAHLRGHQEAHGAPAQNGHRHRRRKRGRKGHRAGGGRRHRPGQARRAGGRGRRGRFRGKLRG